MVDDLNSRVQSAKEAEIYFLKKLANACNDVSEACSNVSKHLNAASKNLKEVKENILPSLSVN